MIGRYERFRLILSDGTCDFIAVFDKSTMLRKLPSSRYFLRKFLPYFDHLSLVLWPRGPPGGAGGCAAVGGGSEGGAGDGGGAGDDPWISAVATGGGEIPDDRALHGLCRGGKKEERR